MGQVGGCGWATGRRRATSLGGTRGEGAAQGTCPPAKPSAALPPCPLTPPRCLLPLPHCRADEEEDEVVVDHSALLPQAQAAPLRKKRWWKWEDRELLTAWAG